jgi:hypothetical protein
MNWFPFGKEGANKVYSVKSECESEEGQECYDITGKDIRYHELVDNELVENQTLKSEVEEADASALVMANAINLKSVLQSYSPDGVHVLQADLDALVAKLDAYMGS